MQVSVNCDYLSESQEFSGLDIYKVVGGILRLKVDSTTKTSCFPSEIRKIGKLIIRRHNYQILEYDMDFDPCRFCDETISGYFEKRA